MKFHELDLNKKCRRKTWAKETYISFSNNDFLNLFYVKTQKDHYIEAIFMLSKCDLDANDWEYLEEKIYHVVYKIKGSYPCCTSNWKYNSLEHFLDKMGRKKEDFIFYYLIDENGDKVK